MFKFKNALKQFLGTFAIVTMVLVIGFSFIISLNVMTVALSEQATSNTPIMPKAHLLGNVVLITPTQISPPPENKAALNVPVQNTKLSNITAEGNAVSNPQTSANGVWLVDMQAQVTAGYYGLYGCKVTTLAVVLAVVQLSHNLVQNKGGG